MLFIYLFNDRLASKKIIKTTSAKRDVSINLHYSSDLLKMNPNYIVAVLTFYFALRAGYCH